MIFPLKPPFMWDVQLPRFRRETQISGDVPSHQPCQPCQPSQWSLHGDAEHLETAACAKPRTMLPGFAMLSPKHLTWCQWSFHSLETEKKQTTWKKQRTISTTVSMLFMIMYSVGYLPMVLSPCLHITASCSYWDLECAWNTPSAQRWRHPVRWFLDSVAARSAVRDLRWWRPTVRRHLGGQDVLSWVSNVS